MISRQFGDVSVLVSYGDDSPSPSDLYMPSTEREAELASMDYLEYLASGEWREKRKAAIHAAQNRCQACGQLGTEFHIHHLTYERRGRELPEDLVALCPECHRCVHGIAA